MNCDLMLLFKLVENHNIVPGVSGHGKMCADDFTRCFQSVSLQLMWIWHTIYESFINPSKLYTCWGFCSLLSEHIPSLTCDRNHATLETVILPHAGHPPWPAFFPSENRPGYWGHQRELPSELIAVYPFNQNGNNLCCLRTPELP